MQVQLGDRVLTQDGHDMGRIKHLILDPGTMEIKLMVVEKGFLLHEDVEMPLAAVQQSGEGVIQVSYSVEQVKTLPHYDESQYTANPPEMFVTPLAYSVGGFLWPRSDLFVPGTMTGFAGALPLLAEATQHGAAADEEPPRLQQDIQNAVISEGDDVYSADGEIIGQVHAVIFSTESAKPTAIVIHKGAFFGQDTTLMADSIASVDDGAIYLNLNASHLPR